MPSGKKKKRHKKQKVIFSLYRTEIKNKLVKQMSFEFVLCLNARFQ